MHKTTTKKKNTYNQKKEMMKKKAKTWDDEILSLVYENYREDYDMFGYDPEGNVVDKPDRAGEPPRLDSLKERIDRLDTAAFDPWRVYDLS